MRSALLVSLLLLATLPARAQITYNDVLGRAEASLKHGAPADARHIAIVIANTVLKDVGGAAARPLLQRAALIRAYADRALQQHGEAEWYWYVAKTLSVSDAEMAIDGVPAMEPVDQHSSLPPVGGEIKAPVAVHRVEPLYPHATRMLRQSGIVIMQLVIDEHGVCRQPLIMTKDRNAALEYAAMEAVAQWTFTPATRDGKPVSVTFNLTINFKLT